MATTINSLGVNLGMDAKGFIDGAKTSRSEARMLAKDIEAARTPAENLAIAQSRLDKAYHDGAISIEVYNRLLEEQQSKARKAIESAYEREKQLAKENDIFGKLSKAGNVVSGIRDGLDMLGGSITFVMDKWRAFDEIAEGLDATKDKAEKLGLTFNELGSLKFATERLGGADATAALDSALGKMLKSGFVDAGESAVDAFKRAADEISGMANQTERAQRAAEIFGKGGVELLAVLQSGSAEIGTLADQWERTNGLTQSQLEFIGEYNDKWDDIKMAIDGIVSVFVAEMAPALTVLADEILGMGGGMASFRDNARMTSDTIVGLVGYSKDLFEIYEAMRDPRNLAAVYAASQFDSAEKMLDATVSKRQELDNKATAAELERKRNRDKSIEDAKTKAAEEEVKKRNKFEADEYKKLIDGNAAEWDQFIKDKAESEKQAKKSIQEAEARDKAETAKSKKFIEQAEKNFEARDKEIKRMREDVAKGPGSGMEAGSAELVKFMADQANAKIAADVMPDQAKPTEEELLEEARRARELQEAADRKMDDQITLLRKIADKETPQIQRAR